MRRRTAFGAAAVRASDSRAGKRRRAVRRGCSPLQRRLRQRRAGTCCRRGSGIAGCRAPVGRRSWPQCLISLDVLVLVPVLVAAVTRIRLKSVMGVSVQRGDAGGPLSEEELLVGSKGRVTSGASNFGPFVSSGSVDVTNATTRRPLIFLSNTISL